MNIARRYGLVGSKGTKPRLKVEKPKPEAMVARTASEKRRDAEDVSRETERRAPAGSELVPGKVKRVPPALEVPDDILTVETREPASPVGQPKMGKPRLVQFTVMQEIGVEEFRRAAGLRSTSEAIRALIEKGLGK